jgi:hypothetical protein
VWIPDEREVVLHGKALESFHPGEKTRIEVGYATKNYDEKETAEIYEMSHQVRLLLLFLPLVALRGGLTNTLLYSVV